jgi:hypothetical protein
MTNATSRLALLDDRLQDASGAPDHRVGDLLEPQLQAGDIAARERLFEFLGEAIGVERGRARSDWK